MTRKPSTASISLESAEIDTQTANHRFANLALPNPSAEAVVRRDPTLRNPEFRAEYLKAALPYIPRLLGAVDRNRYRATYGCFDREFWHYRTAAFPSEMHQEAVLPLALVYTQRLPGNRWHNQPRVRELAIAGIRFAARSSHRDGSCDDYYPFERALGAAVFSFAAATRACELLRLDDAEILAWLRRRAEWIIRHDESGRLSNHHALAALGLARLATITGEPGFSVAAAERVRKVLAWQSAEGWFEEYGGADPGYQSVTIDCLAKLARIAGGTSIERREPLRRGVAFARMFLHPDDSFGGEYGSRGTYHFYPHGMELLAAEDANAADLADGFLRALRSGRHAAFDDDRMYVHRLGNLLEAFVDWSPARPLERSLGDDQRVLSTEYSVPSTQYSVLSTETAERPSSVHWLPKAKLLVFRTDKQLTIVSAARGGVFKHFPADQPPLTDAGLILELADGRVVVSQFHDLSRDVAFVVRHFSASSEERGTEVQHYELTVAGPLHFARFETMTPWKQAALHLGMLTVGRFCRGLMRRVLQRRLITGRKPAPVKLTRKFELWPGRQHGGCLRVTDLIELTSRRARVARMHFGTDHQAAYVAASGVYQDSVLQPWTDLAAHVDELNTQRRVEIVREF
jgi:hypothetical protein